MKPSDFQTAVVGEEGYKSVREEGYKPVGEDTSKHGGYTVYTER